MRIEKAGHYVESNRVDGKLALSRAFGDFQFKGNSKFDVRNQAVTAFPEVQAFPRAGLEFILLACDGLWDTMSSEEAISTCHTKIFRSQFNQQKISDD